MSELQTGVSGNCDDCGSLSFSQKWHQAFGVRLCNDCRADYSLISKGNAKQRYAVSDGDLRKLGALSKPNPQYSAGAPMQLLLENQVLVVAVAKHGNEDGIEAQVEARRIAKQPPAKLAKKKAEEQKAERLKVRVDREAKRISTRELPSVSAAALAAGAQSLGEEVEEI